MGGGQEWAADYIQTSGGNGMIYLASPYSHPSAEVREHRYNEVAKYLACLHHLGHFAISPITHWHKAATYLADTTFGYYREWDLRILAQCTELRVLRLAGWEQSVGVTAELEAARWHRMRISYADPISCEPLFTNCVERK
jgi:hypothetical protein